MTRASGRRPWPQIAGRPTPSTVRCAHRSARGKPAPPERWTRGRLRLRLRSSLRFDLTRFPARAAPGAGAMPPGRLPVRGRTSGRLGPPAPAGPPGPSSTGVGPVRFWGQRAAMPLSHVTACGLVVAPTSATLPAATWLRASGLHLAWHRQDECLTVRGARFDAAPAGFGASEALFAAFARSPFLRPCSRPATPQGPAALRALHRPVPAGCGLGSAPAYWPMCLGALFAQGRRTQEARRRANNPLNAKPERQKGALNLGTRPS